jgi:hypothetical protein
MDSISILKAQNIDNLMMVLAKNMRVILVVCIRMSLSSKADYSDTRMKDLWSATDAWTLQKLYSALFVIAMS